MIVWKVFWLVRVAVEFGVFVLGGKNLCLFVNGRKYFGIASYCDRLWIVVLEEVGISNQIYPNQLHLPILEVDGWSWKQGFEGLWYIYVMLKECLDSCELKLLQWSQNKGASRFAICFRRFSPSNPMRPSVETTKGTKKSDAVPRKHWDTFVFCFLMLTENVISFCADLPLGI